MPLLRKRFSKGSIVVTEDAGGNAVISLKHGSTPVTFSAGMMMPAIERADVQDLVDCLASFAKSTDTGVFVMATGVLVEWMEW